ncbi:hypothetical protein EMCRGX_G013098 [Ephydatia muelleri]
MFRYLVKFKTCIEVSNSSQFRPFFCSATTKTLVLRTQPASISYPSHLFSLAGECFSTTEKGYKYTVCPFFNVTQKEMGAGWNKFEGVLGVWREWIIENDTISGMQFVMGEKCGGTDREAMSGVSKGADPSP